MDSDKLGKGESTGVSRRTLLKTDGSATVASVIAIRGGTDEDLLGTLEVGRLGDVVVLSDDYLAVADEDLKKLHSVLTVLGGRVVHSGGIQYLA